MKATELLEVAQDDIGRYDPTKDSTHTARLNDRKPKLTLRHLNSLKKIRATKMLEIERKKDLLQVMYGAPPAEEQGGGMPGL
jgi:hypothetical protein